MRKYILNLTNNLIGKNQYDQLWTRMSTPDCFGDYHTRDFSSTVKDDLLQKDVKEMAPETLGKILSSFEKGEVRVSTTLEATGYFHFTGDLDALLRHIVATCLAQVIGDRFSFSIPAYRCPTD